MYFLLLIPIFVFAWFLFSRFVFCRQVDSTPLLLFGILFIASLVSAEIALGSPFAWLRFTPIKKDAVILSGYLQHGVSFIIAAVYLIYKRSYKSEDIAVALALWMVTNTAFIVAMTINARIDYPFNLEWMEGTMVDHTVVVQRGEPLYREPTWQFIPFLYGPLFTRITALFPYITESPYLTGRLVSLAMTGLTVMLLFFCISAESKNSWIGLTLSLVFFSSFPILGQWFDIYRTDMLFQFLLLLGGVILWQRPTSFPSIAVAGISLALSVFAKQSAALGVLFFLGWFLWAHGWKRAAYLAGFGAAAGVVLAAYELIDAGWIFFEYFYEMLYIHPLTKHLFWTRFVNRDLLGIPILLLSLIAVDALIATVRRQSFKQWSKSFSLWTYISLLLITLLNRSKSGAFLNCLIPMIIGTVIGIGLWFKEQNIAPGPNRIYFGLLVIVLYMTSMDPLNKRTYNLIPTAQDLAGEQKILKYVKSRPGNVWSPAHTHTCYMAKGQLCFNWVAATDWKKKMKRLPDALIRGIVKHEVQTILIDTGVPRWLSGSMRRELSRAYDCKSNRIKLPPKATTPVTGGKTYVNKICELKPDK